MSGSSLLSSDRDRIAEVAATSVSGQKRPPARQLRGIPIAIPFGDTTQLVDDKCHWVLRRAHTHDKLADFGRKFIGVLRQYNGGFEHLACNIAASIRRFLDCRDRLRDFSRAVCH